MSRPGVLVVTALLVAAMLRLWAPAARPLHHDEGVNVLFLEGILERLGREGREAPVAPGATAAVERRQGRTDRPPGPVVIRCSALP